MANVYKVSRLDKYLCFEYMRNVDDSSSEIPVGMKGNSFGNVTQFYTKINSRLDFTLFSIAGEKLS